MSWNVMKKFARSIKNAILMLLSNEVYKEAPKIDKDAKTWLITIQNFLFPYLKNVYFSVIGAININKIYYYR